MLLLFVRLLCLHPFFYVLLCLLLLKVLIWLLLLTFFINHPTLFNVYLSFLLMFSKVNLLNLMALLSLKECQDFLFVSTISRNLLQAFLLFILDLCFHLLDLVEFFYLLGLLITVTICITVLVRIILLIF